MVDRVAELLDSTDDSTVNTSMRLPSALRDAAALAVEQWSVSPSATTLAALGMRQVIETALMAAALEADYQAFPADRPSLVDVADALAAQEGSPVAGHRGLLELAHGQLLARRPLGDAHDLVVWAEALLESVGADRS